MGNKRKGDNAAVSLASESLSRAVVFSPRDPNAAFLSSTVATAKETTCRKHLQSILQLIETTKSQNNSDDSDPVLVTVSQATTVRSQSLPQRLAQELNVAAAARQQLSTQIAQTRSQLQRQHHESTALQTQLQALQQQYKKMSTERNQLLQQSHQVLSEMKQFRQQMAASQENLQQVQQERGIHVPRLQYQISLYASMTGVRWDFAQQEQRLAQEDGGGGGGETNWLIGVLVRILHCY